MSPVSVMFPRNPVSSVTDCPRGEKPEKATKPCDETGWRIWPGYTLPVASPVTLTSDEDVLQFVAKHPGAIGYVSSSASLGQGVKRLRVRNGTQG